MSVIVFANVCHKRLNLLSMTLAELSERFRLHERASTQQAFAKSRQNVVVVLLSGANVRLLGVVIQLAAGAVPDKAHANAVEVG